METQKTDQAVSLQAATTPDADQLAPLALYFSTGHSEKDHKECQWELHTAAADQNEHYIIGRLPSVDLIGHTHDAVAGPPTCRYAIGVLDEGRRVMRYAEISSGQIVRMEPRARSIQYEPTQAGASQSALGREKQLEQNRRLVDAFGSTRRKRQLKQRDNAQVQAGAVEASEAVASILQVAGDSAVKAGATKAEVMEKALAHRHLPAHNPLATRAQDAYRMPELEPKGVWDLFDIQSVADLISSPEESDTSVPEFIQQCWRAVPDIKSAEGQEACKGIAYLIAALRLYEVTKPLFSNPMQGGLSQTADRVQLQVDVLESFLEFFYDRTEREGSTTFSMSEQKRTLLLMHILMVALILHSYNMGPRLCSQLRQAVKLTPAQFTTMYREMGCVVKSSAPKGMLASTSPVRDLSVVLLPASTTPHLPSKKLAEYFPIVKPGSKRGRS